MQGPVKGTAVTACENRGPMRPLVLLSSLQTGGAERVTVTFLERLKARGLEVPCCTVSSLDDGPLAAELDAAAVRRLDVGAERLIDPLALLRFVRLVRRERIDLVHAHGQDAAVVAWLTRPLTGVPYVVTRHVVEETARDGMKGSLRTTLVRRAQAAADRRIHVSSAIGADGVVIANGIDVERLASPRLAMTRDAVRRSLDLDPDDRVASVVAVLRAGKGHEDLFTAWPLVQRRVPHARLLVAGAGDEAERLRALAAPLGGSVRFLGHRSDVPEILAASDVVVLPSLQEALPTVLIEAAAAARPVVATDVGGVRDVVVDGVTGLLVGIVAREGVSVVPAEPLADAVAQLLADPGRCRAMGQAGRERARELFTLDRQVDATLACWESVLARRSAR